MRAPLSEGTRLPSLTISTVNNAANDAGSIHDDSTARDLGFQGGFVPGPTVLGYMVRLMDETYGPAWLRDANFNGHRRRQTYAGVEAIIEGVVVEAPSAANGGRVTVELKVLDPKGTVNALASASCKVDTNG